MDNFEHILAENIAEHHLIRPDAPVIVAVSGGADSVALLAGLTALQVNCVVAHCNFHLRGAESNRDMHSVQQLCRELQVDLYIKDFDVYGRSRKTGESLEMACRALRYEWFEQLLDSMRAQAVAVAHHREDNIETFFINLLRGSSITGLTGMRWRNQHVIRPMLNMSRTEVEDYLHRRGIAWVDDSTNAESIFARNRLRNEILPLMYRHFPNAVNGILHSIAFLNDNRTLYEQMVREKTALYQNGKVIHLAEMLRDQPSARILLFEMLRPLGFNMSQVDDIMASAERSGLTFTAGENTIELDRGRLNIIGPTAYIPDEVEVRLTRDILSPVHIAISNRAVTDFHPVRDPRVAFFDESVLEGSPRFTLRRWSKGDRITPYGMRGSRLLSDIFTDAKLSADDKRHVWLLTRDGVIIWVVGIRATDRFPVIPDTRRYLMLRLMD